MKLKLTVRDGSQKVRGYVTMRLEWGAGCWIVDEDPQQCWRSVGFNRLGKFERKDNNVLWLWDYDGKATRRNIIILWTPPCGEVDHRNDRGLARIFDPAEPSYKEGKISWKAELPLHLNARRQRVLELLEGILDHNYKDDLYEKATAKLRKNDASIRAQEEWATDSEGKYIPEPAGTPYETAVANGMVKKKRKYTTCGSLPGYVSLHMGAGKGDSLNGTNIIIMQGKKYNCWVEADGKARPLPGDIYVLLDKAEKGVVHVGFIQNIRAYNDMFEVWTTADMGGGTDGWGGRKGTERYYNKGDVRLTGERTQGGGFRKLAGWLNIDKYPFPGYPVHPRPVLAEFSVAGAKDSLALAY